MANGSGDEAAQAAIAAALDGAPAGTQAGAQTEGQADHPHHGHVDSWQGQKEGDGSVSYSKSHTYGDERDN